ncbi:MAG TPA: hypothetical protein VGJ32_11080 [Solirubrobacteraceae bacterium]|jgi:hypothetical protein
MRASNNDGRSALSGLIVIVVGAWAVLAPLTFGADEASRWGWNTLLLSVLPGAVAAVGGLAMLTGERRLLRCGALLGLAGGLWLVVSAMTGSLWAAPGAGTAGAFGDSMRLLLWLAFFFQAGALIAVFSAYALGFLDALATTRSVPVGMPSGRRAREREHARCEARRRRGNVSPLAVQPERLHGAARRHTRPDESAR